MLLGNGNGTFQPIVTFSAGTGTNPQSVAVADVNGDGQSDVITGNYFGNSVGVLLNDGFGSFQPIVLYTTGNHTHRAIVSDVNADNRPDIISGQSVHIRDCFLLVGNAALEQGKIVFLFKVYTLSRQIAYCLALAVT